MRGAFRFVAIAGSNIHFKRAQVGGVTLYFNNVADALVNSCQIVLILLNRN